MATPADRFRLAAVAKGQSSVPSETADDHRGQWVLRRVASNVVASVDNQMFSVGNAYRTALVDVFVDDTTIQVWSQNHRFADPGRIQEGNRSLAAAARASRSA